MINCNRKLMIRVSLGVRKISVRRSKGSELVALAIDPVVYLFAYRYVV